MRIVLDACVPRRFAAAFQPLSLLSVGDLLGTTDLDDGPLLAALRDRCDAFITMDRSLRFQQNLGGLPYMILLLRARSNRLEHLLPLAPAVLLALQDTERGAVREVGV